MLTELYIKAQDHVRRIKTEEFHDRYLGFGFQN